MDFRSKLEIGTKKNEILIPRENVHCKLLVDSVSA